MNFYLPRNHQKTLGFLMISGAREVNWFAFDGSEMWMRSLKGDNIDSDEKRKW